MIMAMMKSGNTEWLGDIPAEWYVAQIGNYYELRNEKVSDYDFEPLSVTMKGIVTQLATAAKSDDHSNRKLVKKGDFVINSRSDRRGSCGISPLDGSVSLINTVMEPRGKINPQYYNCLFHTEQFADEFYKWGHGIVDDLWTTRWQEMKKILIVAPPLDEQQSIANYLDETCSKIDEIIAEAKASIDEYKDLKQSVIFEAVTKGLDKNVGMKDSGIEWIGEIPSSWHLTKVRRIIEQSKNGIKFGPFGSALTNKTSGEAPIYIYGQANLVANDFSFAKNRISEETYSTLSSYEVVPGDICLSMMGTIGKCHTVPENINKGIMDSHLIKIRLNDLMDNRYFEYVYDKDLSGICFIQMQYDKKGSIMDGLNTSIVKGLILPLPTKQEQQIIVDYLDKEVPKIDSLISEKESLINDLEAYKKSLIYEVVTGKRRVV